MSTRARDLAAVQEASRSITKISGAKTPSLVNQALELGWELERGGAIPESYRRSFYDYDLTKEGRGIRLTFWSGTLTDVWTYKGPGHYAVQVSPKVRDTTVESYLSGTECECITEGSLFRWAPPPHPECPIHTLEVA